MFYYRPDFDQLLVRFTETEEQSAKATERAHVNVKEIRDFVPHKVALRIRDFITFSVKVSGRAPDLKLKKQEIDIIEHMERCLTRGYSI